MIINKGLLLHRRTWNFEGNVRLIDFLDINWIYADNVLIMTMNWFRFVADIESLMQLICRNVNSETRRFQSVVCVLLIECILYSIMNIWWLNPRIYSFWVRFLPFLQLTLHTCQYFTILFWVLHRLLIDWIELRILNLISQLKILIIVHFVKTDLVARLSRL